MAERKGWHHSEEAKRKIGAAQKGRKLSEETKAKLRGRKRSTESRARISAARQGRKLSKETKAKISKTLRGRKFSEATLAKKRGKRHTEEAKEKMRQAALERWQDSKFQLRMRSKLGCGAHTKGGYRKDLGYYVRSRWEANFARLLMFLRVDCKYESERFVIKDLSGEVVATYLPDFYLEVLDRYVELKGYWYEEARQKIKLFREAYPDIKLDIIESVDYKRLESKFSKLVSNWE